MLNDSRVATTGIQSRTWMRTASLVGLAVVVAFCLLYRLDVYPAPWYDEGSHLHVAKNYALNGIYADYSSEGIRPFGPAIGVGPTVMLPVAAVFKVFGVNIEAARLVIVVYGMLTLAAFYGLVSLYLPWPQSLLAMLLMLISPQVDFIFNARTVLGEIPGLFFLTTALWLWIKPTSINIPRLLGIGVLFGLACITKNQYALFILPSLLVCWIADLVWYKRRKWLHYVIPGVIAGVMFFAWTYVTIIALGEGNNFSENMATLRQASAGAFLVLSRESIERAISVLIQSSLYGAFAIPFAIYGLKLSLTRDEAGHRYGTLMIFVLVSLFIFVASLGWPRYAFVPSVLLSIIGARLILDLLKGVSLTRVGLRGVLRGENPPFALTAILVGWALITFVLPLYPQFNNVLKGGRNDAYEAAAWMNANIPADATVETWEQELGVLTNFNIHYPPQKALAVSVAEKWEHGQAVSDFYDYRDYGNPDYIIRGPFEKFALVYLEERIANYDLVATIGEYDIFKRNDAGG